MIVYGGVINTNTDYKDHTKTILHCSSVNGPQWIVHNIIESLLYGGDNNCSLLVFSKGNCNSAQFYMASTSVVTSD